jgi:hypothetical protein
MTPVETLTLRLLDGEITDAEYEELRRLLAEDEQARRVHFSLCQQEGLLRAQAADFDVAESTMAQLRAIEADSVTPPPLPQPVPPPVAPAVPAPTSVVVDRGPSVRSRTGRRRRTRRWRPLFWVGCTACLLLVAVGLAVHLGLPVPSWNVQVARVLPPEPARLANVSPGVQIARDGKSLDAETGLDLQPGDRISVPEQAWAAFVYEDATRVLLHPGAEAVFQPPVGENPNAASKRLLLRQGTLAAHVARQSPARAAEITTSNAAVRVLGTRLLLATSPDRTHLDVLQGQVQLTRSSDGASVKVSAGFSAVAQPGAELLSQRIPGRVTQDLAALYLFDEGSGAIVHDRSNSDPPLDLQIADADAARWLSGGGLALHRETVVASGAPARQIIEACRQSNELTIEVWIKPSSIEQVGPARIVSVSIDPFHRNFTLAHETAQPGTGHSQAFFVTRLRTTAADENGLPEFRTSPGVVETEMTHVVYTRQASGQAKIYVDGVHRANSEVLGDFSGWDDEYQFYLANEGTMDRPWLGEYHLVAIYNRAITEQEILQNYKASVTGGN